MAALALAVAAFPVTTVATGREPPVRETGIFDFADGTPPWSSIDDVVMGGVSRSRMRVEGGLAVFEGAVSLDNGGGFASIRSDAADHDLSGRDGIVLRARGDGKVYAVRLRTTSAFDGVSYQATFRTPPGEWTEVRVPFADFEPVFRGRRVDHHPPLNPAEVKTFGFLIAGKQAGAFRLEIDWIKAYDE